MKKIFLISFILISLQSIGQILTNSGAVYFLKAPAFSYIPQYWGSDRDTNDITYTTTLGLNRVTQLDDYNSQSTYLDNLAADACVWDADSVGFLFDSSNDEFMNTSVTYTYSGQFTFIFWVKRTSTATQFIIGHTTSGNKIGVVSNNYYVRAYNGAGNDNTIAAALNTWEMVTITRDANNKIDLYINNGSANRLFSDVAQVGDFLFNLVGRDGNGGAFDFDGRLNDIIHNNVKISESDLLILYNNTKAKYGL